MAYEHESYWVARTRKVMREGQGKIYDRDYKLETLDPGRVSWVGGQLDSFRSPPRVMEIGCGFGRWSAALRGHYSSFTGVDIVPERIEYAKRDWGTDAASFQVVAANGNWDIKDKFDVVMLVTVIQHLPLDVACEVLKSAHRHMVPGGKLLLVEWQIHDRTPEEVALIKHPEHMIPKPMSALKAAVPDLTWSGTAGGYVLQ